jgi:tetratricopeptide (TPR) repeat protein
MARRPFTRSRIVSAVLLAALLCGPAAAGPNEEQACKELSKEAIRHLTEADESGDTAAALRGAALLDRAIVLCPEDPDLQFQLTLAYVLARADEKARASLRRLETVLRAQVRERGGPETEVLGDPRLLYARARISFTFGNNPKGALDDITRLRARDPKFLSGPVSSLEFRCRLAWANLLAKSNDVKEAVRQTRIAEQVARGDVKRQDIARRNLGQILRIGDQWVESQQVFEELVGRYPRDAVLRYALASVLADQLKFDEALVQWREVLALSAQPDTVDPRERDQLADAKMRYGVTLIHAGELEEGKKVLLEFAKANERDARVWFHLGNAAIESWDDPDAAVEWLEKARAIDPWCERTLRLLLNLYTNVRKDEGRAKALQTTLDSPTDIAARKRETDRRKETRPDGTTGCE